MQPNPIDVATTLLAHLGGTAAYSREFEGATLHAIELPALDVPIFLAEQAAEPDGAALSDAGAWIGAEIGTYRCTTELYRLLAGSHHAPDELATFPSLVRSGRVRLWRRERLVAEEISLRNLETATRRLVDDAAQLRGTWGKALAARTPDVLQPAELPASEVQARIDTELRAGGHDQGWPLWLWPARTENARLTETPSEDRWSVGDEAWVAPVFSTDPVIAGDFLRLRYPPNCLHGLVAEEKILVYGAIGTVAFALEDRNDPVLALLKLLCDHHQPTLLDTVAGHLELASKGEPMFQHAMPHGPFGWARPFLLIGSSVTGAGQVLVWDTTTGAAVVDHELTAVWTEVLRQPADPSPISRLLNLLGDRFEHLTNPTPDREDPVPPHTDSTPEVIAHSLDELTAATSLRSLVRSLAARHTLTADGVVSNYVGVRPSSNGTISVYIHSQSVSLALEPDVARRAAERLGGTLRAKNPTTWFLRLSADEVATHMDDVIRLAESALEKSETGPAYEGGRAASAALASAREICPRCRQYELAANGSCVCD